MGLEGTDVPPFNKWMKKCLRPDQMWVTACWLKTGQSAENSIHPLPNERSVYIGLRDIDAPERRILRENKIKCFSMHDVDAHGIGNVVRMALDYVNPGRDKPIHLSFDVDACDPSVAGSECPRDGTRVELGTL
jgi:arginase